MPAAPDSEAAASSLCRACGLCCNGALFSHGKALPEELEALGAAGMAPDPAIEKPNFSQPCPSHCSNRGCTVYDLRPRTCRSYRCRLLRRVDSGEIPIDEALGTVAAAKARIAAEGEGAAALRQRHALRREWAEAGPEDRARLAPRYLAAVALDDYLDRHFRSRDSGEGGLFSWD